MSDHWNLLADLLGTPNYAPRSKKGTKSDPVSEPTTPAKETQSAKPAETSTSPSPDRKPSVSRKPSEKSAEKNAEKIQGFSKPIDEVEAETVVHEEAVQQAPAEQPPTKEVKERSMLQSSWDALASLFGVASDVPPATAQAKPSAAEQSSTPAKSDSSVTRHTKSKKTSGKSMWDAEEEPRAEAHKAEVVEKAERQADETDAPLPSFAKSDQSVDADRRGPRRSPRRGRGNVEPSAEVSSEARDESSSDQERPTRRERSDRGDSRRRQPESGRNRDEDRVARRPKSDDESRATREPDRQEDRDRPRERPQREDRRRERTSTSQGTREPAARKRGGSGFAAGLSNDLDDQPIDAIGFGREDDYNDDQDAGESPVGFGAQDEDQDSDRPRRKKRRGRRRDGERSAEKSEGFDSDSESFVDSDESDRSSESSETRPKHGKIPSWAETIGVVVQANVANHQKQSSGGRGRQRRPPN